MLFRAFATALLLSTVASGQAPSKLLDCEAKEPATLKAAPPGVRRTSKNELRVGWKAGTRIFRDSGYVDGYLGGIDYRYCGYDPVSGFHLISKQDNDVFGGVLLDQATGRVLPAGTRVAFSPDLSQYFAASQLDGLDGENWHLYSISRGRLWKGLSGITARDHKLDYEYFVAELSNPHWSAQNQLQATLTCADKSRSATVTLSRRGTTFVWLPALACPTVP